MKADEKKGEMKRWDVWEIFCGLSSAAVSAASAGVWPGACGA